MEGQFKLSFAFDDILIEPAATDIEPGDAITKTEAARGLFLSLPILSAAMDRVTEAPMAIALAKLGGLGVIHRNCTIDQQIAVIKRVKQKHVLVAAACGPFDTTRARAIKAAGADIIVIDCAHGHNTNVIKSARAIKKQLGDGKMKMVVGNIATAVAARQLAHFADAIKVGIGPGSICTTRVVSGVGVPQFSAIRAVASVARKYNVPVIADGGIRTSGDIVKALAAGASAVMLGNLLAGTKEAPGKIVKRGGKQYKEYRGMGSRAVLASGRSKDRYLIRGHKFVAEGVEAFVPYRGPVADIIDDLVGGLKIGMGYIGARTIADMPRKAKFIYITKAAVREGQPHDLEFIH